MKNFDYIILYVNDVQIATRFYSELFDIKPVESSPGFSLFALASGLKFGLWLKNDVIPKVIDNPGACEIGIALDDEDSVTALYKDWMQKGIAIAQEPIKMDFGYTFTILDPDGHRIRISHIRAQN